MRFYKKKSLIETYELKGGLDGPIYIYGKLGSGKTVGGTSLIQGFHDNHGFKILDVYGGERNEGVFWTIPSQETTYWNKLGLIGKFDESGPKQYKVNLLYPYFESILPKKLPKKSSYVTSKLFTIPLKDLDIQDVMMVIGNPSESSKYAWQELQYMFNKKTMASDLPELCDKIKGMKNTPVYKNFILPLSREKFVMDSYCDLNLDMVEEMRDVETVSVLCLEFVPQRFHLLVINYLLRTINKLLDQNKIPRKNIAYIRECAIFFKATDDAVVEDRFKIFRSNLSNYIRYGRRGCFFALDCQSACLDENTKIISNYGIKKIKNLPTKFKVESYNFKTRQMEVNNATKINTGKKECYKIELENGDRVIATEEHRFFDKNNKEILVKNLKIGDKLAIRNIYKLCEKISRSSKGRVNSQECRDKISIANTGNLKLIRSLKKFNRDIGQSQESRDKLSESTKLLWRDPEYRKKAIDGNTGKKMHWTSRRKIARFQSGPGNPARRLDVRIKIGLKSIENWNKNRTHMIASNQVKPNKPEHTLMMLFKKLNLPLNYVGNSMKWITGKNNDRYNPDFIDDKNKIIVEHFGVYFHNITGRPEQDKRRLKTYISAGYTPIVIWEYEMKNIQKVEEKVLSFYNNAKN